MIYFDYVQQTFFDDVVHEIIPASAQIIDEKQHHEFLNALNSGAKITQNLEIIPRPSTAHFWQDGKWQLDKSAQKAEFQAAKLLKIQEINEMAQSLVNQAVGTDKLPEFEVQSWTLQAAEVKAWQENPQASTPILDNIAAARGIAPDVLKAAALRKTLAYEILTAHIAGQRQALQTRIEQAKNLDELNAIEIVFRLPESETKS